MIIKILIIIIIISSNLLFSQELDNKKLIEIVLPSVVHIRTDESSGSGVIVSINGYILTNYHVIADALIYNSVITILTFDNELKYATKVIDYDEDLDLALIKTVPLVDYMPIYIVNPDSIILGEDVYAIGSPFGVRNYITKGVISKYNTPILFTSASINPGNSGGALVNTKGYLVGIPTMMLSNAQNFNIAICPRTIRYFLEKNKINYKD
jgi:S1-C subfamily serine protease